MSAETETDAVPKDSRLNRLLTGRSAVDFIGRSRLFLVVTLALLALCVAGLLIRGLNFSIDFTGGTGYTVTGATADFTGAELRGAIAAAGGGESLVQVVDGGEGALISTAALDEIGGEEQAAVLTAIAETTGVDRQAIAVDAVGPRWGEQITRQSLRGLVIFLVLVALYIAIRFEARMALAALATLAHDIVVSIGIYAIIGFEVSPASVIAFLTILGYSLYDTVVVFDRVQEDTATLSSVSTVTYGDKANQALNEVLVRSLSTSATSILPVASLLFIGSNLLGAETLSDLALALFIGMAVGTYSSVVVATPFLVWLKEREPKWAELRKKVEGRRSEPAVVGTAASQAPPPPPPSAPAGRSGAKKSSKGKGSRRRR